jgi:hypothetical protein
LFLIFFGIWNLKFEFKYCFILQLLESLYLQPELLFQLLELLFQCCWSYFFTAGAAFSVASVSLSEPLSESPSTIAATKDKILSIDLEASSFDGITNSHEDQS